MAYHFDVAVIGGGAAGLTAAGMAASLGARTALISDEPLGGDCTWTGCVPSKALLHAAHLATAARRAGRIGIDAEVHVDFSRVMERVRERRQHVYEEAGRPEIFEGFGAEVLKAHARFIDPHTLELDGDGPTRLTARYFLIATGGRPALPPIDGLQDGAYLTNRNLFEIETLPDRIAVIGGGPVGVEMGQALRRLGAAVTLVNSGEQILGRDDPHHAQIVADALRDDGIELHLSSRVTRVWHNGDEKTLTIADVAGEMNVTVDAILVATGREPNVENLGLAAAGVDTHDPGIRVDDRCRTSRRHIYAAGDCTGEYQLTHMSEHMARTAITNMLLRVPAKIDRARVPWVTFTDPELGHVGRSEAELQAAGTDYEVYRFPFDKLDRAMSESETTGEVKIFATRWRGKILGASAIGARAGELISMIGVAMKAGAPLRTIADTIFPYPVYAHAVRRAADQWYVRKQFPAVVRTLQKVRGLHGTVPPPPDPDRIV